MTLHVPFKLSVSNNYTVETIVVMFSELFHVIPAKAFFLWIYTYTSIMQCSFTLFLMLAAHIVPQNRDEV